MNLEQALKQLPETEKNVVVVLSGGLDSTILMSLLVEKYGSEKVYALSYNYGQKQKVELQMAGLSTRQLGVAHKVLDLNILGEIVKPVSANISGTELEMPTIKDVLGDPQPKTYVPFRNLILLSLTMSFSEVVKASHVFTGLQIHDEYGYWDTSQSFVDGVNKVAELNRTHKVEVVAPFSHLSKLKEIKIAEELGRLDILQTTMTCYNPDTLGKSCGQCPSCAERINAFMKARLKDPVPYQVDIPWKT